MKNVEIYWTPFAINTLDEIKKYIEKETYSEVIAKKYINKLIERVEQLKEHSALGKEEELLKHLNQNSRYVLEGNYKIIYQCQEGKVIVTDLFHVKQNPIKIIKRNKL